MVGQAVNNDIVFILASLNPLVYAKYSTASDARTLNLVSTYTDTSSVFAELYIPSVTIVPSV